MGKAASDPLLAWTIGKGANFGSAHVRIVDMEGCRVYINLLDGSLPVHGVLIQHAHVCADVFSWRKNAGIGPKTKENRH